MSWYWVKENLTNEQAKARYNIAKDAGLAASWARCIRYWTLPHFSDFILSHIEQYDIEPEGTLKLWLDGQLAWIGGRL